MARAQGGAVNDSAFVNASLVIKPIPGATITVCTLGATGLPCNAPLTIYSNITLTAQIGSSTTADANGNYSYFIAPGDYTETITAAGVTGRTLTRTVAHGIGGGIATCTTTGGVGYENGTSNTLTCNPALTFLPGPSELLNTGPDVAANFSAVNQQAGGAVYALASAGNASGGVTTYPGTFPGGTPLFAGMYVTIAGFTNGANNGRFIVQSFNQGGQTLSLYNGGGVSETHAGTATVDQFYSSPGSILSTQARMVHFGSPGTVNFPIRGVNFGLDYFDESWPGAVNYGCGVDGNSTDACYIIIVNNGATGDHYTEFGDIDDGTGTNPNACRYGHQGGVEDIRCSKGGGTFFPVPQTICSGQIALTTGAIGSGARATNTLSCSGLSASTDSISCTFSGDTNAVTGYAPSAAGGLSLKTWASASTINVDQVNDTSGSITPGAATVNCKGIR